MGLFDEFDPGGADGVNPETGRTRITVTPLRSQAAQPRGIRNNNPGNIEDGPFARSLPGYAGSDGRFARFAAPEAGEFAIQRLLDSYAGRGINTPAGVVSRWAPADDGNPVPAYSAYVAEGLGVSPDDVIDLRDPKVRSAVAQRIAEFENGKRSSAPAVSPAPVTVSTEDVPRPASGLFSEFDPDGSAPKEAAANKELSDLTAGALKPKPMAAAPAAALGAAAGASANFQDEIVGASNASGLPGWLGGLRAPVGLARLAYEGVLGDPGPATRAYQEGRDAVRSLQKRAQRDQPGAYLAGEVGGALATIPVMPAATVARGAGLGARTVNAAVTGAAYGASAGTGAGEGAEDTVRQTVTGAGLGAGVGAVAAPLIELAGQGAQKLLGGVTSKGRDVIAARDIERSLKIDHPTSLNVVDDAVNAVEQAQAGGVPVVLADMGGPATRRLADASSIKSPAANKAFADVFNERAGTQKDRLIDTVKSLDIGAFDSVAARAALQDLARAQNKPAYMRAYEAGDREIWTPELERLTAAPYVQRALSGAISKWKNYAVRDGFGAMNPPFRVENGGLIKTGQGGMKAYPNIQLWDYAARDLQDKARAAPIGSQQAGLYNDLARLLKTELDKIVPEYKVAREGAAGFFGAQDAIEAGQKFLTARLKNSEARDALAKMVPADRDLFASSFASEFIKMVREVPDRTNVMNRVLNSPAARERVEIALGPDGARRLEAFARLEGMMQATKDAVAGNSKTVQRYVDAGLAGTGLGINLQEGDFGPSNIGTMMIVGALTKSGRRAINEKVAQRVGELLTSKDPKALRDLLDMAARNPRLLDTIRRADSLLPRLLAQEGVKALPSTAASRADTEQ
ncbi:hypothetical protein RA307_04725 [Xanthobacteraceae bacterium Astr-EGSB]|uniref:hypothetical protein n=1 Tax=Astrobacterium formosum TaxID=3069710 RepID=UPI0027B486F7|nr:hypothetical protein [Xanthobacteraceae bacterium Astr-EGSB]